MNTRLVGRRRMAMLQWRVTMISIADVCNRSAGYYEAANRIGAEANELLKPPVAMSTHAF